MPHQRNISPKQRDITMMEMDLPFILFTTPRLIDKSRTAH